MGHINESIDLMEIRIIDTLQLLGAATLAICGCMRAPVNERDVLSGSSGLDSSARWRWDDLSNLPGNL